MSIRDRAVAYALSLRDLAWPDERYLALVDPNDQPARRLEIGKLSGCALVQEGILRALLGIDEPGPYVIGRAPADLLAIAHAADAVRAPSWRPKRGDIVQVDQPGGGHFYLSLTDCDDDEKAVYLECIEGGQRDVEGHEDILCHARMITYGPTHALDHRDGVPDRVVLAVLDLEAMAAHYGEREEAAPSGREEDPIREPWGPAR